MTISRRDFERKYGVGVCPAPLDPTEQEPFTPIPETEECSNCGELTLIDEESIFVFDEFAYCQECFKELFPEEYQKQK